MHTLIRASNHKDVGEGREGCGEEEEEEEERERESPCALQIPSPTRQQNVNGHKFNCQLWPKEAAL